MCLSIMPESQVLHGGCLCGKVRYTITATTPGETPTSLCNVICHCKNCKKATGTHMANTSMFSREHFALTSGTPGIYEDKNQDSGNVLMRRFCRDCGSPLYITSNTVDSFVAISSGTLDDVSGWWTPNTELYLDSKSHWLPKLPVSKKEGINEQHQRGPTVQQSFV